MSIRPADRQRNENVVTDLDVARACASLDRAFQTDRGVTRARASLDRSFAADRAFQADVAAAAVNARKPPASDHGILYIGFNPESEKAEVAALGTHGKVRTLTETSAENDVVLDGKRYDLSKPGQVEAFVQTLKLDPRVAPGVERALKNAEAGSREKLAQIAVVFAGAEHGKPIPSRLVISAHSGGLDAFGGRGSLAFVDLQRLARAMPKAAACIEDIHLSACATSGQAGLDGERAGWQSAFPHLKTMWAYAGSSPLAPASHLGAWAKATSGTHDSLKASPQHGKERVAVWSKKDGYHDAVPLERLRVDEAKANGRFARFMSGELTGARSGEGADPQDALADYQTYRVLSQKNALPATERTALAAKADQLLRIRYYTEGVRSEFAKRHASEIESGFRALGLPIPSFATLSRKEALAQITAFEQKLARAQPAPAAAAHLAPVLRGFRDLDSKIVLTTDCHH